MLFQHLRQRDVCVSSYAIRAPLSQTRERASLATSILDTGVRRLIHSSLVCETLSRLGDHRVAPTGYNRSVPDLGVILRVPTRSQDEEACSRVNKVK